MSVAEFNAAGELGRQAAGALDTLQGLPGFVGVSLKNGKILVQGAGPALQAKVAELNQPGPANFVLVAPSTVEPPAQSSRTPEPTAASPAAEPGATSGAAEVQPAASAPELVAHDIDQLFQAYVSDVGTRGLQAVAYTAGHFVIRTGSVNTAEADVPVTVSGQLTAQATASESAAAGKLTPAQFVSRYANVQLEKGAAVKTEDDIFGGQGFFVDNMLRCSTGFSAFDPTGLPLILTAGHCTQDGSAKAAGLEPLGWAPASGSATPTPWPLPPLAPLGNFGFSQFGGLNNAAATADGSPVGTDIAVITDISPGLNLQPAATTWDDAETPEPVKIVGAAAPVLGGPVCRSGRTTGWKCGFIDSIAILMMPGSKSAPPDYDNDLRPVRAFDSTSVTSAGGDSGGPWISGNYAVGTHTGAEILNGVQTRAIAATLEDSLASIPGGVQLDLFLNKPSVTAPATGATFDAGQTITGTVAAAPASAVAAGSTVKVTLAGEAPFEVPVDGDGAWSFTAPAGSGRLNFTAETVNGFSASGPVAFEFAAVPPVAAPAPVTPPAVQPAAPPAASPPAETPAQVTAANGAPAPATGAAVVVRPLADEPPTALAKTGASGLFLAAGLAAAALAVGGVLLAVLRRRKRQPPAPTPGRSLT
ncbi:S1 family peptidase [Pseudarthrobacter sulfonivorans]|uniref:S1 family peptidase n=1 Tax=Pseudarthrobacter sulfonivorans TaxID=121292 RepID=UPI00168C0AC1|nr:S1 family peptidase [Pseudarthrobacter sulfonivorans]